MNRWIVAGLFAVVAAGCGHARLISRNQTGGVFALEGDRNEAMKDAQTQMTQHCQGPYQIVAEGEQIVGSDSAQSNETYVTKDGRVVNQGGQSTRDAVEWRVQYECTAGGDPGAAPYTEVPSSPSPGPSQSYPQQPYPQQPNPQQPYPQQPYPQQPYPQQPPPPPPPNY